jgi:hypothetical protein
MAAKENGKTVSVGIEHPGFHLRKALAKPDPQLCRVRLRQNPSVNSRKFNLLPESALNRGKSASSDQNRIKQLLTNWRVKNKRTGTPDKHLDPRLDNIVRTYARTTGTGAGIVFAASSAGLVFNSSASSKISCRSGCSGGRRPGLQFP